jgi:hypothetical protein
MKTRAAHFALAALLMGICLAGVTTVPAAPAPTAHREAACGSCHDGGTATRTPAALDGACTSCHGRADQLPATDFAVHGASGRGCLDCHAFHEPSLVRTRAGRIDLDALAGVDPGHCRACHDPRGDTALLSPAHRAAARLYHEDLGALRGLTPSEACLECHANGSGSPWQGRAPGQPLTFNQHASHPYGVRVIPGSGNSSNWIARDIDPRLRLFRGRMECQTCHLLSAGNDDLMVPFPAKYDLCKGCHRHYGDDETRGTLFASLGRP